MPNNNHNNSLENRIIAALGNGARETESTNFSNNYHANFESSGRKKAQEVIKYLCDKLPNFRGIDSRLAYFSIGGSTGSEIDYVLRKTNISYGLLLEFDNRASNRARERQKELNDIGKHLEVLTGNISDLLTDCQSCLKSWRKAGKINGILVSIQAVMHELPTRGHNYSLTEFLSQLVDDWDPFIFISREPSIPSKWVGNVIIHVPDVKINILENFAETIRGRLRMPGRVVPIPAPKPGVKLPANLAVETLTKIFYIEDYDHEIQEQVTSLIPSHIEQMFMKILEPNNVIQFQTISESFLEKYRKLRVEAFDDNLNPLPVPDPFSWVIAFKITTDSINHARESINPITPSSGRNNRYVDPCSTFDLSQNGNSQNNNITGIFQIARTVKIKIKLIVFNKITASIAVSLSLAVIIMIGYIPTVNYVKEPQFGTKFDNHTNIDLHQGAPTNTTSNEPAAFSCAPINPNIDHSDIDSAHTSLNATLKYLHEIESNPAPSRRRLLLELINQNLNTTNKVLSCDTLRKAEAEYQRLITITPAERKKNDYYQ
ncbi:MAG: hypothetical protein HQL73_06235 [Magnetococcales bacterium]|nr:hypothetical protein [Magnetococcales bacterium]